MPITFLINTVEAHRRLLPLLPLEEIQHPEGNKGRILKGAATQLDWGSHTACSALSSYLGQEEVTVLSMKSRPQFCFVNT